MTALRTAPAAPAKPTVEPAGRLKDKVALITGGTRGLGWAIACAYAREGAKIVIAARTESELKARIDELSKMGAEATAARVDLADESQALRLYSIATRTYGRIDVLVNNASILGPMLPIVQYSPADWHSVMNANLTAAFLTIKGALGTMIPANKGSIINVSSGVGRTGRAKWGAYAVSKGGLETLTQVLADELSGYNIRVNTVNPGGIQTGMRAAAFPKEDPHSLPAPEDMANAFVYLASDVSKGVTGQAIEARDFVGRQF